MNLADHLISHIYESDKEIEAYNATLKKKEIDITQPNWQEQMIKDNDLFHSKFAKVIGPIENELVGNFKKFSEKEREKIWGVLSEAKNIQAEMSINYLTDKSLENIFLLEIIRNLRPDPRDALLYINELIEECEQDNIDYKVIIKEVLPFADHTDWSGMGSMKAYLERLLE